MSACSKLDLCTLLFGIPDLVELIKGCFMQLHGKIALVTLQQQRVRDLNTIQAFSIQDFLGKHCPTSKAANGLYQAFIYWQ